MATGIRIPLGAPWVAARGTRVSLAAPLKDCAFEELAHAIRAVAADRSYLSPEVASVVVKDYVRRLPEANSALSLLSDREREVLPLLAEGKSTQQISSRLEVSTKTVETHRRRIMKKAVIWDFGRR